MVLPGVLAPAAQADDGRSGGICKGATMFVKVCAADGGSAPGTGGGGTATTPAGTSGAGGSKPSCTYPWLDPQPPPDNTFWKGHDRTEKGAVYGVNCPHTQGALEFSGHVNWCLIHGYTGGERQNEPVSRPRRDLSPDVVGGRRQGCQPRSRLPTCFLFWRWGTL